MSFIQYIKDTKAEMKHVVWPKRATVVAHTVVILVVSLLVSALLAAFDFIFKGALERLLNL